MKKINKYLEFDFDKNTGIECRFDSTTVNLDEIEYKLAIMQTPAKHSAAKLHFSYLTGLTSDIKNDTDIVSQLLSIYTLKSTDEDAYNRALVSFFSKYGFLSQLGDQFLQSFDRATIDEFLKLIFLINEINVLVHQPFASTKEKCDKLLELNINLIFTDLRGDTLPLRSYPLLQYIIVPDMDYDPDEDMYYCMKSVTPAYHHQINEFSEIEKYNPQDVIINAYDVLKGRFSDDAQFILNFLYNHLCMNHFALTTSPLTGEVRLKTNDYTPSDMEDDLIEFSDKVCNYFLSQASRNIPLIVESTSNKGIYTHTLKYDVKCLADAVIFALLLFDPVDQEFRKCHLPSCNNYFLTKRSNMKKLYCCRSHTRTAATHRFRESK